MSSKYIVFLGPAGSGKGTQAQEISLQYNMLHLSTGDLLRDAIEKETDLGIKASSYMSEGNLVPDDVIIDLVDETISNNQNKQGVVFDGFPRTLQQAKALDALMQTKDTKISQVFLFDISLEESIERITGRRVCPKTNRVYHVKTNPPPDEIAHTLKRREDDSREKATHRYEVYLEQTKPLIHYYQDKLVKINAIQTISEIKTQLNEYIKSLIPVNLS